jgi:ADP-heptose:LPS heptosyltransferase
MKDAATRNILVIKLGALGDFIQALGPMAAIRKHHPQDSITLLTTALFETLAHASGYFDHVKIDTQPKWHDPLGWLFLRRLLNDGHFTRVYDLQNNDRTALYLKLFSPRPEWVGAAPGASHRNTSPERVAGKAFEGHVQTLALAGIQDVTPDRLNWIKPQNDFSSLPMPYVLLVIGAAPQHPEKCWPYYREICHMLQAHRFTPVLIGGKQEAAIAEKILLEVEGVISLVGKTALFDLPTLATRAHGAIGNDTGPMHLIAPTGCKSIVLFSNKSTPRRHAPLGQNVITLQRDSLADLKPQEVWNAFAVQHSLQ